jgi:4-amino-4-deoxy-L-arabinose transferase-like glycosyltransferase
MERTLVTSLLPWNLALLLAAVGGTRGEPADPANRFLHAWWLAILIFFTLSSGKRPVYLLPLQPAIALLAGRTLREIWMRAAQGGVSWHGIRASTGLVAIVATLDVGAWGGSLLARHHQSGLRSLAPFAAQVKTTLRADAHVYAGLALPEPQVLVLAYALDRRIERRKLRCSGSGDYFLLLEQPDGALASSGLSRAPVSLVRDGERCPLPTRHARVGQPTL